MKVFNIIVKIGVALAAIAGAVYAAATYGDKIVAWAKGLIERCKSCEDNAEPADEAEQTAVEEVPEAEEAPAVEEAPAAEEVPAVEDGAVVAEETDFEG